MLAKLFTKRGGTSNLACGLSLLISAFASGPLHFLAKSPFSSFPPKKDAKEKTENSVAFMQPTFCVKHFTGLN